MKALVHAAWETVVGQGVIACGPKFETSLGNVMRAASQRKEN